MKNCYYVYVHRKRTDGTIFYVGKGKGERAWSTDGRNRAWLRVAVEHGREVEIVMDGLVESAAFWEENKLIRSLIESGVDLVNIADREPKKLKIKITYPPVQVPEGSLRPIGYHKREPFYTWKRVDSSQTHVATVREMSAKFSIPKKELVVVVHGKRLATRCGWCIYKPRGPRRQR